MRAVHIAATTMLSVLALGCAPGETTALLEIAQTPGLRIASLSARVSVDGQTTIDGQSLASENGAVELPGTMLILLPDTQANVIVQLVGATAGGGTVEKSVAFLSVPHQQVYQFVTLGSSQPDPADGVGSGGTPDLGTPVNAGTPDLAAADGNSPPPPDLAPPPVVPLARDDFQRPNQPLWGRASDGQLWGLDANTRNAFSIVGKTGRISDGNKQNDTGVLGPVATNSEILVTGSLDDFTDATELGPVIRFTDNNNFYKAIINGSILKIVLKANGTSTDLVTVSFNATAGTLYSIRLRASGSTISAKAWPAASAEPTGFALSVTDATFTSGYCGVRLVFNASNTATFTSFAAFPL